MSALGKAGQMTNRKAVLRNLTRLHMDDDNAITANYQTALVNALRPIADGLAAFHTVRQRRNGVSQLSHSPLACTHCGHHPVSVRSATSQKNSGGRVHRLKRTCSTCHFVELLDLGAPPAVSRQTKKEKKKRSTKESGNNGNDNGNTAKLNGPQQQQQQSPAGSHVTSTTSTSSSSMKRTNKKLSELQLLLARHRQKKDEQTKKQSSDSHSGLSAFLESL